MSRRLLVPLLVLLLLAVGGGGVLIARHTKSEHEVACAGGEKGETEAEREREHDGDARAKAANGPLAGLYTGPRESEPPCGDVPGGHPESFAELAKANSSLLTKQVAPGTSIKAGAYRASIRQGRSLGSTDGEWSPYGGSPVQTYRKEYDTTNRSTSEGLGDIAGRATSFTRDGDGNLYVAASNGGVWKTTDGGGSWTSVGDGLPTQVVAGIAWTPANGGTLIALTGDNAYGGSTYAGLGAYRSTDGGATWSHAAGIPDGVLSFELAVDPTDPNKVYAATGAGLFRSTDGGASYTNTSLPTGDCAGKAPTEKNCFLANMVTSVVVQAAGGKGTAKPGAVMAAVGWRAGTKDNAAGVPQSPGNGTYTSDSGEPGTFQKTATPVPQAELGRIALGIANGAQQDHNIVYAMVQDANKFNGGAPVLDVNDPVTGGIPYPEVFSGLYVSTDFGATWKPLVKSEELQDPLTTNSAIAPACQAPIIAYCPGVQAWYNLWVSPDPTQQTASGVPTRLAFGLEEVWSNDRTLSKTVPLDGSLPVKFKAVGRYYADESCTILNATNGLPVCPVASGGVTPKYTTHPDQHGAFWLPSGDGGVSLFAANDGGVYKQSVGPDGELSNDGWGKGGAANPSGNNAGMHTLQPYDVAMAKDGTAYVGLQDNGEVKIEPSGDSYSIFGGDGFFTAVDPDNSQVAYEEYVAGAMSVTKDGGKTWDDMAPTDLTDAQFSTPFEMDPNDAKHLVIGGRQVFETGSGPDTGTGGWAKVFDLGTQKHAGDANATTTGDDPVNQLSAVDTLSVADTSAPTGPKTKDFAYDGGATTIPDPVLPTLGADPLPTSYEDHPFTIGAGDGDQSLTVKVTWADPVSDWDLTVLRKDGDTLTPVASSATSAQPEQVVIQNPQAGDYVVRVQNFAAAGTFHAEVTFTQREAGAGKASATYVGFCGYCDTVTQGTPFANGLATNVSAGRLGQTGSTDNWHIAKAAGLPSRYITSVRIDPSDPRTVFVTLAGYGRRWAFPGALGEDTSKVGTGHVFKSTDAGETFTDISGNLPDTPADWTVLHNGHLVVGTDIGVFESTDAAGGDYVRMGSKLPASPITTMMLKPGDPDTLVAATYGRGVYTFSFKGVTEPTKATPSTTPGAKPAACTSTRGFKSVKVSPKGRGLRFSVKRRLKRTFSVDVFQQAKGRTVIGQRRIAHFAKRSRSFTWKGRKGTDGLYFVRVQMKAGAKSDARRPVFRRAHGRFHRRPAFYGNASCKALRLAKLSGPAFGGVKRVPLGIALQTGQNADVTVTATQGSKRLLKRSLKVRDRKTHRLRLAAKKARPGDVKVTVVAKAGAQKQTVRLTAQRLR